MVRGGGGNGDEPRREIDGGPFEVAEVTEAEAGVGGGGEKRMEKVVAACGIENRLQLVLGQRNLFGGRGVWRRVSGHDLDCVCDFKSRVKFSIFAAFFGARGGNGCQYSIPIRPPQGIGMGGRVALPRGWAANAPGRPAPRRRGYFARRDNVL